MKDNKRDHNEVTVTQACKRCIETCKSKVAMGESLPHFPPTFIVFFMPQYHRKSMKVPETFCRENESKLQESIVLEGPTGQIWLVEYQNNCFAKGWEDFVNYNYLKEGQLLKFSLLHSSFFEVKIFNPESVDGMERKVQYKVDPFPALGGV